MELGKWAIWFITGYWIVILLNWLIESKKNED